MHWLSFTQKNKAKALHVFFYLKPQGEDCTTRDWDNTKQWRHTESKSPIPKSGLSNLSLQF